IKALDVGGPEAGLTVQQRIEREVRARLAVSGKAPAAKAAAAEAKPAAPMPAPVPDSAPSDKADEAAAVAAAGAGPPVPGAMDEVPVRATGAAAGETAEEKTP